MINFTLPNRQSVIGTYLFILLGFASFATGTLPNMCAVSTLQPLGNFGILNVTMGGINQSSANASAGYQDFTSTAVNVNEGQIYNFSIQLDNGAPHNVRGWIDWNNDSTFSNNEQVIAVNNTNLATGSITIPATSTKNICLRFRISAEYNIHPVPGPCDDLQQGQTEDYAIMVVPNTSAPVAGFSVDQTKTCNGVVQFNDATQFVPTSRFWLFGDGNSSGTENPQHTYTNSGTYTVTLIVTNSFGSDTLEKVNYIEVDLTGAPASSCAVSTANHCCGYGIYNVSLNQINNSTAGGEEGYQDYSCNEQAQLTVGTAQTLTVTTSSNQNQKVIAWVDWDGNGTFTSSEEVLNSLTGISHSSSFTVPADADTNSILRMRIASDATGANMGACINSTSSQLEDYGIRVLPAGTIGILSHQEELKLGLYPNPATNVIHLKGSSIGVATVQFYDILGKNVSTLAKLISSTALDYDISRLPKGVYLVLVNQNDKSTSARLIKR